MPNKKKTVKQREEELAQRILDDVNSGIDARFECFERLMDCSAPAPVEADTVTTPEPAVTRSKKRSDDQTQQQGPPSPKVSKSAKKTNPRTSFHYTINVNDDSVEVDLNQTPWNVQRQSAQARPRHPSTCFAEQNQATTWFPAQDPATSADTRSKQTSARRNNDAWAAWTTAHESFNVPSRPQGRVLPPTSPPLRFPTSTNDVRFDETLDLQVKQILATTAHNLGKGNSQPYDFPYKYILRGPEKIKATINSVTLPEHLWGIFRIIHDPKSNPDIKPCLMVHIEQIVEDAREFEWEAGVRGWSEEVFSRISEGRLVNGWHSYDEIQRMRMIIAQSKPITTRPQAQSYTRENFGRKQQFQNQPQFDILRGGPPLSGIQLSNWLHSKLQTY